MADNSNKSPTTNLEDTALIAYMMLKGHQIKPWRSSEDPVRVSFDIEGDSDKIEYDMQNFYNNNQVGIQDYVKCLKQVKSIMYNMKKLVTK
jgi:hypothetical protein